MPGTLDFRWDPLELAADNTFSTTIRIEISNWWEAGAPRQVSISVRQRGEDLPPGHQVLVQKGKAVHPLTGLEPRHHYLVVVSGEDRQVEKLISVPELPKPKSPEQESLEREEFELAKAKVARQLKQEKKEDKEPTRDEKKTADLKAKTERVKAEKEFREVEKALKQVEPPEPKPQLKVLHLYRRLSRLEVVLQRVGKDGRPEDGAISVLDFEQGGVVFGDASGDFPFRKKEWGVILVFLPYFEYPRQVTFFLPDNPAAKTIVDVPARVRKEKKPKVSPKPSVWEEMRAAYREERDKDKTPAFLLKIQRRQPLIFP